MCLIILLEWDRKYCVCQAKLSVGLYFEKASPRDLVPHSTLWVSNMNRWLLMLSESLQIRFCCHCSLFACFLSTMLLSDGLILILYLIFNYISIFSIFSESDFFASFPNTLEIYQALFLLFST